MYILHISFGQYFPKSIVKVRGFGKIYKVGGSHVARLPVETGFKPSAH